MEMVCAISTNYTASWFWKIRINVWKSTGFGKVALIRCRKKIRVSGITDLKSSMF